ncbi:hypothetical protein Hanom_Chr10g00926581 [Helianthus anomalus]
MGRVLCEGAWTKFYQGHRNTTVLNVPLMGQTRDATGLLTSLNAQQQTETVWFRLCIISRPSYNPKRGQFMLS